MKLFLILKYVICRKINKVNAFNNQPNRYINNIGRYIITMILSKEEIFSFRHIFTGFMQLNKDEKSVSFIHHRVRKKNIF